MNLMDPGLQPLAELAGKLFIGDYHRHVFLCTGETCNTGGVAEAAWEVLKRELKDRNLSLSTGESACYRTKVGCLRVCSGGPILLVYPEGTYYAAMTAERISDFVQKHLVEGQPTPERIFARNPLSMV